MIASADLLEAPDSMTFMYRGRAFRPPENRSVQPMDMLEAFIEQAKSMERWANEKQVAVAFDMAIFVSKILPVRSIDLLREWCTKHDFMRDPAALSETLYQAMKTPDPDQSA